jgi:hypothetical protein
LKEEGLRARCSGSVRRLYVHEEETVPDSEGKMFGERRI